MNYPKSPTGIPSRISGNIPCGFMVRRVVPICRPFHLCPDLTSTCTTGHCVQFDACNCSNTRFKPIFRNKFSNTFPRLRVIFPGISPETLSFPKSILTVYIHSHNVNSGLSRSLRLFRTCNLFPGLSIPGNMKMKFQDFPDFP